MKLVKPISIIVFLVLAVVYAAISGGIPSYLSGLTENQGMSEYQNYVSDTLKKKSISTNEMEDWKDKEKKYLDELSRSNYSSKSFTLNYIIFPIMFLVFGYIWYRLGRAVSGENHAVKLLTLLCVAPLLFYFGYAYQPLIHISALCIGLFFLEISKNFKKNRTH